MDVLIIDDDKNTLETTASLLNDLGHCPFTAFSTSQADKKLNEENIDAVLLNRIVRDQETLDYLEKLISSDAHRPVVVFTDQTTIQSAVDSIRKGAFSYLEKPIHPDKLKGLLENLAREIKRTKRMNQLEWEVSSSQPMVILASEDEETQYAYDIAFKAARSDASILLLGPSGNGKSVLARQIHENSKRAEHPFITVSCPSLSAELLESELFGHVKGAFTGAIQDSWGKVHAAEGGTLFLDEIGELPLQIQPKLLRLLQEQEYERVGETRIRKAEVRIISATNRDLSKEVENGNFREDLLYRVNVISIAIPPLARRQPDIEKLAAHFLDYFRRRQGRKNLIFAESAVESIRSYAWPGNLRELSNVIERAVILTEGDLIEAEDLALKGSDRESSVPRVGSEATLEQLEEAHIRRILEKAESIEKAARILGIDTATLYRKRKKMGLL